MFQHQIGTFVFFLGVVVSSQLAQAETTMNVPVMLETSSGVFSARDVNALLLASGAPPIPEYILVSDKGRQSDQSIGKFVKSVEGAVAILGGDWVDAGVDFPLVPGGQDVGDIVTCYTGDAVGVKDLALSLADVLFSDQMSFLGQKYKNVTEIYYAEDGEDARLSSESSAWKNWTGNDETVLMLFSVGDGGDDVQESVIRKCSVP